MEIIIPLTALPLIICLVRIGNILDEIRYILKEQSKKGE